MLRYEKVVLNGAGGYTYTVKDNKTTYVLLRPGGYDWNVRICTPNSASSGKGGFPLTDKYNGFAVKVKKGDTIPIFNEKKREFTIYVIECKKG